MAEWITEIIIYKMNYNYWNYNQKNWAINQAKNLGNVQQNNIL